MSKRLKRSFIPWLIAHFFEFWFWYVGAFVSLYVLHRLQTELPAQVKLLTDVAEGSGEMPPAPVQTFMLIALGILIFRTLSRLLFFTPARFQQKILRTEMLEEMEKAPPARYANWNDGQLYQVLFNDFNNLRAFVGFALLQLGNVIVAAFVMIPRLNDADPNLWVAFIPMGASVFIFSVLVATFQKYAKAALDAQGQVQNHVMESYAAKATVKNYHREQTFIERFNELSWLEMGFFFKSSVGFAMGFPLIRLGLGLSLLWGALIVRQGGGGTSDLVFFAGYLFLMLEPLMFLSWMAVVTSQGLAAWKRVKNLHNELQAINPEETKWGSEIVVAEKDYQFKLPYWDNHLSLSVPKDHWIVLCGETGSGKSELLKKMGHRLAAKDIIFSMVQQEPYLFNDTIEANIFLGKDKTEDLEREARTLLKLFGLDILALNGEDLLSIEVGENGKRLSGGQAKRLSLVRSLLSQAEVILWDDPFSSVDIVLERKIILQLKQSSLCKGRTFILTSHRLTTVKMCDQSVLLDPKMGIKAIGDKDLKGVFLEFFQEQMVAASSP